MSAWLSTQTRCTYRKKEQESYRETEKKGRQILENREREKQREIEGQKERETQTTRYRNRERERERERERTSRP